MAKHSDYIVKESAHHDKRVPDTDSNVSQSSIGQYKQTIAEAASNNDVNLTESELKTEKCFFSPRKIDGFWNCCGLTFLKDHSFLNHKDKFHADREAGEKTEEGWKCCGIIYLKEKSFISHKFREHREDFNKHLIFFCYACGSLIKDRNFLDEHKRNGACKPSGKTLDYKPMKLTQGWMCCGTTYKHNSTFLTHRNKVHIGVIDTKKCRLCHVHFENSKGYMDHQSSGECKGVAEPSTSDVGKDKQEKVTSQFQNSHFTPGKLKNPKLQDVIVLPAKLYECDVCRRRFKDEDALIQHGIVSMCETARPSGSFAPEKLREGGWLCCGLKFRHDGGLEFHKRKEHPDA